MLRVAESPLPKHQSLLKRLLLAHDEHVRSQQLGEVWVSPLDIIFDERRALVLQPDLFFISSPPIRALATRTSGCGGLRSTASASAGW